MRRTRVSTIDQYTSVGGASQSYDSRGNLTTGSYGYDIFNRLISGPSSATLAYDASGRLYQTAGGGTTTRFLYDGAQIVGEYNSSNVLQRRFIPGPALDEPIAWYEGASTSDRRWLASDERGSVIAVMNSSGAATAINTYDEYGQRGGSNAGRFQYTGQPWLPEVSLYHYRARAYSPTLGRFMQTDPILHQGGINLYAYVGNDPVNRADAFGLDDDGIDVPGCDLRCRLLIQRFVNEIVRRVARQYGDDIAEQVENYVLAQIEEMRCGVSYIFSGMAGAHGFGASLSGGAYFDHSTGLWGMFVTPGVAVGEGASIDLIGIGHSNSMRSFTGNAGTTSYTLGILGAHGTLAPPVASNPAGGGGGGVQVSLGAKVMGASTYTVAFPPLGSFAIPNESCVE